MEKLPEKRKLDFFVTDYLDGYKDKGMTTSDGMTLVIFEACQECRGKQLRQIGSWQSLRSRAASYLCFSR